MSRFVDPFTDTGFKIIFGKENKSNEILKAFLNDLFEGQPILIRLRNYTILIMRGVVKVWKTGLYYMI